MGVGDSVDKMEEGRVMRCIWWNSTRETMKEGQGEM